MRLAKAWCWIILLVGCGGRVQIGHDLPDAGKPPADSDAAIGTGGTSGQGGSGAVAGSAGAAGSGGVAGSSATGGAGGAGATGGAGGIAGASAGGAGGTSGDGGSSGTGGASGIGGTGPGGSAGSAGAAGTGGSGPSADAGGIPPWPDPTPCPPSAPSPLIGQWVGRIENYQFPSGSNLVHLFIEGADDTSFCGSVTFGVGPLPPATNPDVGYPPGANIQLLRSTPAWHAPYEGFIYRLSAAIVSGNDIRSTIYPREAWKSWCVLQASYPTENGYFRCMPNGIGEVSREAGADGGAECALVDSSNRTVIDCDKLLLCGETSWPVCECNAVGCTSTAHPSTQRDLSGHVDGAVMKGNVRIDAGGVAYPVEFVRN